MCICKRGLLKHPLLASRCQYLGKTRAYGKAEMHLTLRCTDRSVEWSRNHGGVWPQLSSTVEVGEAVVWRHRAGRCPHHMTTAASEAAFDSNVPWTQITTALPCIARHVHRRHGLGDGHAFYMIAMFITLWYDSSIPVIETCVNAMATAAHLVCRIRQWAYQFLFTSPFAIFVFS